MQHNISQIKNEKNKGKNTLKRTINVQNLNKMYSNIEDIHVQHHILPKENGKKQGENIH